MAERRQSQITRSDVLPVVAARVGPIVGHTEYTAAGVAVFVPPSAPHPDGLEAATAELEAGGCTVAVEDLGRADPRGRWRVTATKPGWERGAGCERRPHGGPAGGHHGGPAGGRRAADRVR